MKAEQRTSLADELESACVEFDAATMSMSSIERLLARVRGVSEEARRIAAVLENWGAEHTRRHPHANVWGNTKIATHDDCQRWARLIGWRPTKDTPLMTSEMVGRIMCSGGCERQLTLRESAAWDGICPKCQRRRIEDEETARREANTERGGTS